MASKYQSPDSEPQTVEERLVEGGWIKLWRKTADSAVADDMELLGCWIYLLMEANWAKRQLLDGTILHPGDQVISMDRLAQRWGCSKSTVHSRLRKFQKLGMISTVARTLGTVVTICHWRLYQADDGDTRTQTERKPNANRTQAERKPNQKKKVRSKEGKKERRKKGSLSKKFVEPTEEEVATYFRQRGKVASPENLAATFCAFYGSKGWMVGKNKMKSWRKACVTWEQRQRDGTTGKSPSSEQAVQW